nr:glycosyltransferase [Moraxella sp. CTOTU47618]
MVNLSLIVPVYNVENYIIECLNSIVKIIPTDGSTEVIIVNDGSPDNSINLIENYILNLNDNIKNNFHILSQENRGLSGARNTGINNAKGRYLAFLDSDDVLQGDFFNDILAIIKKHNPDIVEFRAIRFDDNGNTSNFFPKLFDDGFYNIDQKIWKKLCNRSAWFSWLRVYNKNLFDDIRFPEGKNYEDAYTTPYVYLKAKNIYFCNNEYIGYRINPNGITATKSIKNIDDIGGAAEKLIGFFNYKPELSSSFISLAQNYIADSFETEGFFVANKRWKVLKEQLYTSSFDKKYIVNRGNKFFFLFGIYFISAIFYSRKFGIKK